MRTPLTFLFRLYFFWVLWFLVARCFFLAYHFDQTTGLSVYDLFMINLLGIRMDLSMAGYLTLVPGLLLALLGWYDIRISRKLIFGFSIVMLASTALVAVVDLELYRHWGYRMDATPLLYMRPEGFGSVRVLALIMMLVIAVILLGSGWFAYGRTVHNFFPKEPLKIRHLTAPLVFVVLLFIPIRSGFGIAPLNTGFVYYHPTLAFPNHAGINVSWNFFRSLVYSESVGYKEKLVNPETAKRTREKLVFDSPASTQLIEQERPNILLIVLEGFAAKLLTPLGANQAWTPNLNEAASRGILFDSLFASGDRTDKGMVCLLSGYPAQPRTSIIKYPGKTRSLPYWPRVMANQGYHTSFIYGGDPRFANMESYLVNAGFSHITRDDDFDASIPRSKWGVHDEHLFQRLAEELDTTSLPFFKVALTLSSHEPFDVPFGKTSPGDSDEKLYLNSVRYTDSVLGNFLNKARGSIWWKDTWIIITADHGHRFPGNPEVMDPERFRIPMLWTGGAVADTARMLKKIASQTDIVRTVLSQLKFPSDGFEFSKNILSNESPACAAYAYNNGYGFITSQGYLVYDLSFGKYLRQVNPSPVSAETAKGYMQALFNDYNSR